ncbi:hypothetical protein K7574_14850 [Stenotrophomonas maltophilia]|uniref:hypothetical protein n=1 Tax=Stenotrophomonas maltophilia TaxID=40324 RepID=UPI001D0C3B0E|nr:hypothetical protein [Stenotrophomonas maltophilia]UXF71348.1 hypothetical protein K7574_14850 [Stenotrophomonas maltophilia]
MSMLDGVSQCWRLSETCAVNWEAWSAVGTVAAVFIAIFAPSIQRMLARRKVNALFGMTYQREVARVHARLEMMSMRFPLEPKSDTAWAVHSAIQLGGSSQAEFTKALDILQGFAAREIDITKWGAVDLELPAKVAALIVSVQAFVHGAEILATTLPDDGWMEFMANVHVAQQRAQKDAGHALVALNAAVSSFR